jgi:hypothetical protein
MPSTEYETRSDSVLAWKKAQKLGRFDPNAPSLEEQKIRALEREVEERGKHIIIYMDFHFSVPLFRSGEHLDG